MRLGHRAQARTQIRVEAENRSADTTRGGRGVRLSRIGMSLTLATAAAAVAVAVPANGAKAATVSVTSCANDGPGTLRAAVSAAGSGDTITFAPPATFTTTCTVANTITVESPIDITTANLTIQGPGAAALAISGGGLTSVLQIGVGSVVRVDGLTVRDGWTAGLGGGIFNEGSLTVSNSVVTANHSGWSGGGIAINRGSLVLLDSTVAGNESGGYGGGIGDVSGSVTAVSGSVVSNNVSAVGGGGLWLEGPLAMTGSTVSGNQAGASGIGFSAGGGVATVGGTITGSVVSGNSAVVAGGGIYNSVEVLTVSDSTVSDNTVIGSGGNGGGLAGNTLAPLIISRSTISGNSAPVGGGVSPVEGSLTITASTFSGNTGSVAGGDAYVFGGFSESAVTISNSTFVGNSADQGGIVAQTPVTMSGSIVDGSDCNLVVIDDGYNLDSGHTCVSDTTPGEGSMADTASGLDPNGLGDHGGPTATIAVLAGSPAIGVIPATSGLCTPDQRGATRPDPCDTGAYQSAPIVDTEDPTITHTVSPAPNSNGWNDQNVTVTFTCADLGGSGVASCLADGLAQDYKVVAEGAGQSVSGTATDEAGNTATDTASGINVDTTAPTVALVNAPPATFSFGNNPPDPTCTASDGLSGISGACAVTGGGTAIGTHTWTATATDVAGNTATATSMYTVQAWSLTGFHQPVDMNGVWNTVKGGSTVPLRFEVFAGTEQTTTAAIGATFTAARVACSGGAGEDPIEMLSTGGTALRYDNTAGQFIQNWKTPTGAGLCYSVTVTTADGGSLTALFKTK